MQVGSREQGVPDDPGMDELPPDDETIHEEDAQQQQHAASIGHHNGAGGSGYDSEESDSNLVGQEQQGHEHEEPAQPNNVSRIWFSQSKHPSIEKHRQLALVLSLKQCRDIQVLQHPDGKGQCTDLHKKWYMDAGCGDGGKRGSLIVIWVKRNTHVCLQYVRLLHQLMGPSLHGSKDHRQNMTSILDRDKGCCQNESNI